MSGVSDDIRTQFISKLQSDPELKRILKGIKENGGDYKDAEKYASRAGQLLTSVLQANISESNFPVGAVNEIAGLIIPAMELNYNAVTQVSGMIQKTLNKDGGIGMNSITPEFDRSNAMNVAGRMANYESFEDAAWMLEEPIQSAALGVTDDTLRKNAEFQYKSGMKPKIVRICESGACEWCRMLEGEYDYEEVKDRSNPVWQRHNNCTCEITYEPGDGRVQDVYSKQWIDPSARAKRIRRSIENNSNSERDGVDIQLPGSAGAKWRNYDIVDPDTNEYYNFIEHSKIHDPETFAGYGTKTPLHPGVAEGLTEEYGGDPKKWRHRKGIGHIDVDGEDVLAEVHWFQEETAGKHKFKIKKWL